MVRTQKIRFTRLDFFILSAAVGLVAWLVYRVETQLDYSWQWEVIPQYLFRYDEEEGRWVLGLIMQGVVTTIKLSLWATVFAALAGGLMGICKSGKSLFRRLVGGAYVELVRNMPPLVLIFLFYFFFSDQIMTALGVEDFVRGLPDWAQAVVEFFFAPVGRFDAFVSALFTLALYEGAYITEIVRSGIESVEKGQHEAAYALGLSNLQKMRHIILPQAFRRIIPPLAGQFISTIKDSAIVSVISIQELTFQGMELMAATFLTFEIWITVILLYLIMCLTFSLAARKLEARLAQRGA